MCLRKTCCIEASSPQSGSFSIHQFRFQFLWLWLKPVRVIQKVLLNRISFCFVWCSKTTLKLAVSRIKLLKNKREAQIKQLKRELAQLLESGQDRTARIRVTHNINNTFCFSIDFMLDVTNHNWDSDFGLFGVQVEHVVREEKTMAAYDLVEIYCELIAARLPMIESQKYLNHYFLF